MSSDRKVLSTTDFVGNATEDQGKQWFWSTKAVNGKTVGDGSEGYNRLTGAVEGFFSQQSVPNDVANAIVRGDATLSGPFSKLEKIGPDHFRITRYEDGAA